MKKKTKNNFIEYLLFTWIGFVALFALISLIFLFIHLLKNNSQTYSGVDYPSVNLTEEAKQKVISYATANNMTQRESASEMIMDFNESPTIVTKIQNLVILFEVGQIHTVNGSQIMIKNGTSTIQVYVDGWDNSEYIATYEIIDALKTNVIIVPEREFERDGFHIGYGEVKMATINNNTWPDEVIIRLKAYDLNKVEMSQTVIKLKK